MKTRPRKTQLVEMGACANMGVSPIKKAALSFRANDRISHTARLPRIPFPPHRIAQKNALRVGKERERSAI